MNDETARIKSEIDHIYSILTTEEMFSRAKEYSWQTFFHHSTSVAIIAFRIARLMNKNANSMQKRSIESIEEELGGLPFEELVFLVGFAHDYSKLHSKEEKTGKERIKQHIKYLLEKEFVSQEATKKNYELKVIACANAVEGKYDPQLDELYVVNVVPPVRIADMLMGFSSVDEAISYIHMSKDWEKIVRDYGLRFGFIRVSASSILQAKISKNIVKVLQKNSWYPLVLYADGMILLGDKDSCPLRVEELYEAVRVEVEECFGYRKRLRSIVRNLERLALGKIYNLFLQNYGHKVDIDESKVEDLNERVKVYYNLMVDYLNGARIDDVKQTLEEWKNKLETRGKRKIQALIDVRSLATRVEGKGSRYFDEELGTILVSIDSLIEFVKSLDEREKFLLLSYMVAFTSKDIKVTTKILNKALSRELGDKSIPDELIRLIAIAEVYRSLKNVKNSQEKLQEELIRKCFEALADKVVNIDIYVRRFIASSLKSNIFNTKELESYEIQKVQYCRVCGAPLDKATISFATYGQAVREAGGVSEIWLHDDPPLANLEKIASDKRQRIRFICPLCFYEAEEIKRGYRPPFLAITLHPVVAYDLWEHLESKITSIFNLYKVFEGKSNEVARIYAEILGEKGMKITEGIINELRNLGSSVRKATEEETLIIDSLGARIMIPLGGDMSQKKKYIAAVLALVPIALSISGGGQVGVVNTLSDAYNLGVGIAPVVTPHSSNLVLSIIRTFEKVREYVSRQARGMTPDEYAVYNQSYITILELLYIYGLKLFSLYGLMRGTKKRDVDVKDYALELHEFLTSTPYITVFLDAPPPERLDPRKRWDEPLPYSFVISSKIGEVESRMSQVSKICEGKETPSLSNLIYGYAANLSELNSNLSRYKVQKPLREGIDLLLQYAPVLGEKDSINIATDKFLELIARTTDADLNSKKRVKTQEGQEITYSMVFRGIFKDLAELILRFRKELNPTQLKNLIEVMLDSAYHKYRYGIKDIR